MRIGFVSLLAAIIGLGSVQTAISADMPLKAPYKAAPMAVPAYNWTGPYAGIQGGYGWSNQHGISSVGTETGYFSGAGGFVGGTLGYNWQLPGGPLLLGVEGDGSWSKIQASGGACVPICNVDVNWSATFRGRLGYVHGPWLAYATGGLALAGVHPFQTGNFDYTETLAGWTVGGGVEWMFMPRWSVKAEYLYTRFANGHSVPVAFLPGASAYLANFTTQIVRGGINFHF